MVFRPSIYYSEKAVSQILNGTIAFSMVVKDTMVKEFLKCVNEFCEVSVQKCVMRLMKMFTFKKYNWKVQLFLFLTDSQLQTTILRYISTFLGETSQFLRLGLDN